MSVYLEIRSLPLLRTETPVCAPAAAMALRMPYQKTVELYFQKQKDGVHCYLGLPDNARLQQAAHILRSCGCSFRKAQPQPPAADPLLLCRAVSEVPAASPSRDGPVQILLADTLVVGIEQHRALFDALHTAAENESVCIFLCRQPAPDARTASWLRRMQLPCALQPLLEEGGHFGLAAVVYGSSLLAAEAGYALGGLEPAAVQGPVTASGVWQTLSARHSGRTALEYLRWTCLRQEAFSLTDLSAAADVPGGLPTNPDTLLGMPVLHPPFSQTGPELVLGKSRSGETCSIPLRWLRYHMVLAGAPGSGKGNMLFSTLYQLHKAGIPILSLESAKNEQHHLSRVMPDLCVWRPQAGSFAFDPFDLPEGITLGEYRSSLIQMLRTAFLLDGPLEELFTQALNRCFALHGYSEHSTAGSAGTSPFGMHEFITTYDRMLRQSDYSDRTRSDMRQAGLVRLNALFNQDPDVFDSCRSIPVRQLLEGTNLIQLNCLPSVQSKQLFATLLLASLGAYMKLRFAHCSDKPLRLVVVMDESHNLLRSETAANGTEYSFAQDFVNLLLEMRSLGVGFIIADQSCDNIPPLISDIAATKVFLGNSLSSGILRHSQSLGADQQTFDHLYLLGSGQGLYTTMGMAHGTYFETPNLIDTFCLEQELSPSNPWLAAHPDFVRESFVECADCPARGHCTLPCKQKARQRAVLLAIRYAARVRQALLEPDSTLRTQKQSGVLDELARELTADKPEQAACTAVQLGRIIVREQGCDISVPRFVQTLLARRNPSNTSATKGGTGK